MNVQKFVAIVLSILINGAVLALFHVWSTAAVASAAPPAQRMETMVRTLPTITVYPTRAQMEQLHREAVPATKAGGVKPPLGANVQDLAMPYYSFEGAFDAANQG
ncbi:MAG: hypothetical protein ACREPY_11995 [Rhodanobacteraceae bacterium]